MHPKNLIGRAQPTVAWEEKMGADVGYSPRVIACPSCPKCGTRMLLVRIFPDSPGHDQRTYECPRCEHEVTEIFQLERRAPETA
jgi:DNA-directed RNA polymerase subunit RPC12/RpoP